MINNINHLGKPSLVSVMCFGGETKLFLSGCGNLVAFFTCLVRGKADGPRGLYKNWDLDLNGKITIEEVIRIYF